MRYAVSHQQPVIRSERRMKVDILRTLPLTQLANAAICTQNKLGKTILVKRRAKIGGQHRAERHRRFRVLRCTLEQRLEIAEQLKSAGIRVKVDDRDTYSAGWKFNEWELKGVPVRVEVGPRDLAEGKVLSVRRDTFEKAPLDIEGLEGEIKAMLDAIQTNMFEIARAFRDEHTADVHSMEELEKQVNGGYAKAMWCGDQACEDEIKDRFGASSRCMPFDQTPIGETCVCCGKPAKKVIYFAKAY